MSFEKWLENKNEAISDTCSEMVGDLYAEYVYEMNGSLSDVLFFSETAEAYADSWFN